VEKRNQYRSFLLIGGIIFVVVMLIVFGEKGNQPSEKTEQQQLAALLSEIHAVGQVQVYFHYETIDSNQGFLAVSQQQQTIAGVIIVAEGAHTAKVKQLLKETVSNVLQIPKHRIQIVPMQIKEEPS
jgi:stage III sporulation protein AG